MAIYCPQGSGTLRQHLLMMHDIAWYCIVLHSIAWYCMVLHGIAWYCMVLHCIAWYCMVVHGIAWYWMVLHGIAWYCIVLHGIAWYCMVLHGIAWYCKVLHSIAWYSMIVWNWNKVTASCEGNRLLNLVPALVLSLILWDICVSCWFSMILMVSGFWQHFLQNYLRLAKMTNMAIQSNCVWWKMCFIPLFSWSK